jgi:hypothetical protein
MMAVDVDWYCFRIVMNVLSDALRPSATQTERTSITEELKSYESM